jgi:NADH:ubiquinone oxidoreductase subunit 6 (subunit J)
MIPMPNLDVLGFLVLATFAVLCGLSVILQKHAVASALSLVGVMGSLAVLYLMLGAEFLAAVQMIVYAGAIMVLFVFVIMLLNSGSERPAKARYFAYLVGIPSLLAFLGVILFHLEGIAQHFFRAVRSLHARRPGARGTVAFYPVSAALRSDFASGLDRHHWRHGSGEEGDRLA